jgi:hypothetical protein
MRKEKRVQYPLYSLFPYQIFLYLQTDAQKITNKPSLVYLPLFLIRKKQQGASPYCFVLDVNFSNKD